MTNTLAEVIQNEIGFNIHEIADDDTGEILFSLDNKENNPTEHEKAAMIVEIVGRTYDDRTLWVRVVDRRTK